MKKSSRKILAFTFLLFSISSNAQTFLNKVWEVSNGSPGTYDYVSTALCGSGNLIYIGNNMGSTNCDILLNCINTGTGSIGWSSTCPSSTTNDDYGADVKLDAAGNIYVCAAKSNGSNMDYLTAKYSSTGTLIWQKVYNGGVGDDVPAAIAIDASGNVYVTGSSMAAGIFNTNFVTIKYNSSGVQQWLKTYDFSGKPEVATNILIDNSGNVIMCGGSTNTLTNSDITIIKYNSVTGVQMGVLRHVTAGNGFDLPSEMITDGAGKFYIVGTSEASSNKNIKVLALNNSLGALWVKYTDKSGNADEGYGIALD